MAVMGRGAGDAMSLKVPKGFIFSSRFILPALSLVASPGDAISMI
jgi:hypothetical protein